MISHSDLLYRLIYNGETGNFVWNYCEDMPRKWNTRYAGTVAGWVEPNGQYRISIEKKKYTASILAWFYVHGYWPVNEIDHIDLNPLNNKFDNLREATGSQNVANQGVRINNTSGCKGVNYLKEMNKFVAKITVNYRQIYLGSFVTIEEAATAYENAAKKYFGEFARVV